MGDLNRYFSRSEFACKCGCGLNTVDAEVLSILTCVREYYNKPVHISSGCRCLEYNRSIGSNDTSQHPLCRAVDFIVEDVLPIAVWRYITDKYVGQYGIGKYTTFTHFDSRSGGPARW